MQSFREAKRLVVKVGTSTLTYDTGLINIRRLEKLVEVLSDLLNSGLEIVLVTSGAIGVGRGKLRLKERPSSIPVRQAVAAVGQCELMYLYDQQFARFNHIAAQMLLTKDVVDNPILCQNAANTFRELFELGAIPVVNENDSVATDELEGENFGDNDTLSAVVAKLVDADGLILLSDIDGLYTANPHVDKNAKLIPAIEAIDDSILSMASDSKSNRGTGGMITKVHAAQMATEAGIDMAILNGERPELLYDLLEGKPVGTVFRSGREAGR